MKAKYLGLHLSTPIVVTSSHYNASIGNVEQCVRNGAGAVVLKSIFEAQIYRQAASLDKMEGYGDAGEYLERYLGDAYKAEFCGSSITLPQRMNDKLGSYVGKSVLLGIRPEDIHETEDALTIFTDNVITADVHVTELLGAEMHLYLAIEDTDMIATVNPRIQVKGGDRLKLAMDPSRIHVFDKETEQVITN